MICDVPVVLADAGGCKMERLSHQTATFRMHSHTRKPSSESHSVRRKVDLDVPWESFNASSRVHACEGSSLESLEKCEITLQTSTPLPSMSDSELSDAPALPADSAIEKSLRSAVRTAVKEKSEVTVNAIRDASEQSLNLEAGFFRSHATWKQKSKEIIQGEFSKVEGGEAEPSPKKPATKSKQGKTKNESGTAKKRASPAAQSTRPRKKARKSSSDHEDEESEAVSSAPSSDNEEDDATSEVSEKLIKKKTNPKQSTTKPKARQKVKAAAERSTPAQSDEAVTDQDEKDEMAARIKDNGVAQANDGEDGNIEDSDSSLSDVIDGPAPTRRKKSSAVAGAKSDSTSTKTKPKAKTASDDPDAAQIRLLQSQLAKCGIRKVWGKELKPFETPRDKIRHLKSILSDVGMTGRFSEDKARQIKEERELKADLEAVQEGNHAWGVDKDPDMSDGGAEIGATTKSSRGRLIRGAKTYDFLSDDGEETD